MPDLGALLAALVDAAAEIFGSGFSTATDSIPGADLSGAAGDRDLGGSDCSSGDVLTYSKQREALLVTGGSSHWTAGGYLGLYISEQNQVMVGKLKLKSAAEQHS